MNVHVLTRPTPPNTPPRKCEPTLDLPHSTYSLRLAPPPGHISGWDTSAVTDMSYLFSYETTCNPDIGAWDTSSVTTMQAMFYSASSFDQGQVYVVELRLRKWVGRGVQSPVDLFRSFHAPGNRRGSKRQTHPPTHSLVHLTNVPQTSVHGT